MSLSRPLLRFGTLAAALLSGISSTGCDRMMYGMPPPDHERDVTITDFSYSPASPIHVGDTLTFRATLTRPTAAGFVCAVVSIPEAVRVRCNDEGLPPDEVAGDSVYSGALVWDSALGTGSEQLVYAEIKWYDGTWWPPRSAAPLTVLPAEVE